MKYILTVLFLILMHFGCMRSLKTSDLCVKEMRCRRKYSYECETKYCSNSREACNDLTDLNIHLQTIKNFAIKQKILNNFKTIKKCPVSPAYEWKKTDICFNKQRCHQNKGLIHLLNKASKDFYRHAICPCNGAYKIQCRKQYCALSEDACNGFEQIMNKNMTFYGCGNFFSEKKT